MMANKHILLLFVDGVGLGEDDPQVNPFCVANLPTLHTFTQGKRWTRHTGRQETSRGVFLPTDPRLGVAGRPQSGSSQAVILTGINVPQRIGEHYGPKPNLATREIINQDNFFMQVRRAGGQTALLDAYPPSLLKSIGRGKTLPSSIQQSAIASGQMLLDVDALRRGEAITAEWTGQEWHSHLKLTDTPIYTPQEAGKRLAELAQKYHFSMHSHWMTDYVGHRGTIAEGVTLLERLDGVIEGILSVWDDENGLVILTSDHGNLEQLDDRHHTENDVPTLVIGSFAKRFADGFHALTDIVPKMAEFLEI